jgi:NNP family nitrate/nitrite transporter-like MFS transporter
MAVLLVIGAIPSGLAGTVRTASGLYTVRFFIGILGGTFVPCQAWTTAFFDKSVVGSANALVGGWGNSGGGFTFLIMIALYDRLLKDGLSSHSAWRAAFAIVPVPALLFTALLVWVFGTDSPAGSWADRHNVPAAHMNSGAEGAANHEGDEEKLKRAREADETHSMSTGDAVDKDKNQAVVTIAPAEDANMHSSSLDTAINEPLTFKSAGLILSNPLTWLPAIMYFTTFGYELAIDANLANVLFAMYKSKTFTQTQAGYVSEHSLLAAYMLAHCRTVRGYLRPDQRRHSSFRWLPG